MAGRLEQYDSFISESSYVSDEKKPMKRNNDKIETRKSLDTAMPDLLISKSRKERIMLDIFYTEKRDDGTMRNIRRRIVVPRNRFSSYSKRTHIEVIDVNSMTRKIFRRDRIKDIKPTEKVFGKNPEMVGFK